MRETVALAVAAVLAGAPLRAQQRESSLTLTRALKIGLSHQAAIAAAQADADEAQADIARERSAFFPSVVVAGGFVRGTYPQLALPLPTMSAAATGDRPPATNLYAAGMTLTQIITDFGRTMNRVRAADEASDTRAAALIAQRHDTVLAISTSYFAAQTAVALQAVAAEGLRSADRHMGQAKAMVAAGFRAPIDLARATTDRANANLLLIQADNELRAAKRRLSDAMGVGADVDYEVDEALVPTVNDENAPLTDLATQALASRAEIRASDAQVQSRRWSADASRSEYWPIVVASAAVLEQGQSIDRFAWSWSAQIGLVWPVLEGGRTRAEVRRHEAQLRGAEARARAARLQVQVEVTQAADAVRTQRAAVTAATEAAESSHQLLADAEARYKTGIGSALELSDAQLATNNAEGRLVMARFTLSMLRAQLEHALGRDLDS